MVSNINNFIVQCLTANFWHVWGVLLLSMFLLKLLGSRFFYSRWHIRRHFSMLDLILPNSPRYYTYILLSILRDPETAPNAPRWSTKQILRLYLPISFLFLGLIYFLLCGAFFLMAIGTPVNQYIFNGLAIAQLVGTTLALVSYWTIFRTLRKPKLFIHQPDESSKRLLDNEIAPSNIYRMYKSIAYIRIVLLIGSLLVILITVWGEFLTDEVFRMTHSAHLMYLFLSSLLTWTIATILFKKKDPYFST